MASTRTRLQKLNEQKEKLEEEIKAYGEVLESQGNVGMHGSLVDEELYPRNDIDVYTVRQARQHVICLQNDHKALMAEIEHLLTQLHKEKPSRIEVEVKKLRLEEEVLAVVGEVDEESPAHTAGFQEGDRILRFGSLDSGNFKELRDIAKVLQSSQGQAVSVQVQRNSQTIKLSVLPAPWKGGLLGCKVLPFKK